MLEDFNYAIEHRSMKRVHVNALSRSPLSACMLVNECGHNLIARVKHEQKHEDATLSKLIELAEINNISGYVIKG